MNPAYLAFFKSFLEGTSEESWEVWFDTHQERFKAELPLPEFLRLKQRKLEQVEQYLREAGVSYAPLAVPERFAVRHRLNHACRPAGIVACHPKRLCVSTREGIYLWNTENGQLQLSIHDLDENAHQAISVLALSPDGKFLATGIADLTTKVYDAGTGVRLQQLSKPIRQRYNAAEQLSFSSDGTLLAAALGRVIELFRVPAWEKLCELKGHSSKVHLLRFVAGSNLLVSAGGRHVKLWDAAAGDEIHSLPPFKRLLGSLSVSANGSLLATGGKDGLVMLWSLPECALLATYRGHRSPVFGVSISPDDSLIASSDFSGALQLWRVKDATTLYHHRPGCALRIAFSQDGKLAAAASRSRVTVLQTDSASCLGFLPPSPDVAFLSNHTLASADGQDVVIWQLRDVAVPDHE